MTDEFSHRGLTQRNHRALDFALTARRFHSRPLFGQSDQYFVLLVASNTSVRSIPSTNSSISAPFQSSYGTGKRRPTAEAVAEPDRRCDPRQEETTVRNEAGRLEETVAREHNTAFEKHYRIGDLARAWGLDRETIRSW